VPINQNTKSSNTYKQKHNQSKSTIQNTKPIKTQQTIQNKTKVENLLPHNTKPINQNTKAIKTQKTIQKF